MHSLKNEKFLFEQNYTYIMPVFSRKEVCSNRRTCEIKCTANRIEAVAQSRLQPYYAHFQVHNFISCYY